MIVQNLVLYFKQLTLLHYLVFLFLNKSYHDIIIIVTCIVMNYNYLMLFAKCCCCCYFVQSDNLFTYVDDVMRYLTEHFVHGRFKNIPVL